jgi:hypothetical protein
MPKERDDLAQIGATAGTRRVLERLRDDGHVAELVDAYRLCVAVACAWNVVPDLNREGKRTTMFAAGTVDTSTVEIRMAIAELYPNFRTTPYRAIEDLAGEGAKIVDEYTDGAMIRLHELVAKATELAGIDQTTTE